MPFEDLTLEQLRAATKDQILNKMKDILTEMTRKRLCDVIWTIKLTPFFPNIFQTLTQGLDDSPGQLIRVYELSDILGVKLGSTKTEWTYYKTGEVDTITTTDLDENDQVTSVKTIKHFTDGRQPITI